VIPEDLPMDLAMIWGFPMPALKHCRFIPETAWSSGHLVAISTSMAMSYQPSTHPRFPRRKLLLFTEEEPWVSDEVLPSTWKKTQIWEHLRSEHSLPDL
jgi:hypothetical protein